MSGSVAVSGTITTGNACSLRFWKITGSTTSTGTYSTWVLPTGCTYSSIVGAYGGFFDTVDNLFMAFNNTWFQYNSSAILNASFYINASDGLHVYIPSGASSAASVSFTIIIVTYA